MQEENRRLIDEALEFEAVKNTFRLAWEFIKLNKQFTFTAMGIFVLLNLFGNIPVLAFVFAVLAVVFGIVIQMHIGRTFYGTDNIETYVEEIHQSRIDEIVKRYAQTAFGVYLGWFLLIIIILFSLGLIGATTGVIKENMSEKDLLMAFSGLGLPLILFAFIFSYVQPLVHSNIVLANSLGEGFKAVFSFFTKDVWSSALQKSYFVYIAKVGLVAVVLLFVLGFAVGILAMVPVVGVLSGILVFMIMYLFMVFMSITSMMARRIVEE